jgi:hypothetical protein
VSVAPDVLAVEVEREQLYQAWLEAYRAGRATLDTHPVLSESRAQYQELSEIVQAFLDGADFEVEATAADWSVRNGEYCVEWQRI